MEEATQGHVGGKPYFFGREYLLRSLLQGTEKGWSFGLCGGPKSGKTSTLYQLKERSRKKWKSQPGRSKVVPVILDLKECKGTGIAKLPEMIWNCLIDNLSDPLVRGGAGDIPAPKPKFIPRSGDPWELLATSCSELWNALRGTEGWCRYLICIDHGDLLLTKQFKNTLGPLLEFAKREDDAFPLACIVTGTRILREYLFDDMGYFHQWLRPMLLGPLLEGEALAMTSYWIPEANENQKLHLLSITGNHPYLLARILREVKAHNLLDNLRAAMDGALIDLEILFDSIWTEFDLGRGVTYRGAYAAPEHALMQLLVDCGDDGSTIRNAERELGMRPLKDYCEFLEYECVVERTLRGDAKIARAKCALWNEWYRDRISL